MIRYNQEDQASNLYSPEQVGGYQREGSTPEPAQTSAGPVSTAPTTPASSTAPATPATQKPSPIPQAGQNYGGYSSSPVTATGGLAPAATTQPPAAPKPAAPTQPQQGAPAQPGWQDTTQSWFKWGSTPVQYGSAPPAAATYQPGTLPQGTYGGTAITQFQAPQQQAMESATQAAMMRMLANPESLSPQVVAMLKEQQKAEALAMQQQQMAALGQSAAGRGVTDGNWLGGQEGRVMDRTMQAILQGNRGVDITAAQTNMQDRLNAINAGNTLMTDQLGRATAGYNTGLAGQQAMNADQAQRAQFGMDRAMNQEGLQQAGAASNLATYQADLSRWQAEQDLENQRRQLAMQNALGQGSLNLDQSKLASANNQFNQSYNLDMMRFLNDAAMGRYNLGLGYGNLQQQMLDWLGNSTR